MLSDCLDGFGDLSPEQVTGAGKRVFQDVQAVLNSRLGSEALIICKENAGFRHRVRGVYEAGGVGVADGSLQVLTFILENLLDLFLQVVFLSADLGAYREQGAAQNAAVLIANLRLEAIVEVAVFSQPFQGSNCGGKDRVQFGSMMLPVLIEGDKSQFGFGVKKVIEAAFFDASLVADVIDGRGAVRARPDQLFDGFHQSLFRITDAAHRICSFSLLYRIVDPLQRQDELF